jgi:hypothetical protein
MYTVCHSYGYYIMRWLSSVTRMFGHSTRLFSSIRHDHVLFWKRMTNIIHHIHIYCHASVRSWYTTRQVLTVSRCLRTVCYCNISCYTWWKYLCFFSLAEFGLILIIYISADKREYKELEFIYCSWKYVCPWFCKFLFLSSFELGD